MVDVHMKTRRLIYLLLSRSNKYLDLLVCKFLCVIVFGVILKKRRVLWLPVYFYILKVGLQYMYTEKNIEMIISKKYE